MVKSSENCVDCAQSLWQGAAAWAVHRALCSSQQTTTPTSCRDHQHQASAFFQRTTWLQAIRTPCLPATSPNSSGLLHLFKVTFLKSGHNSLWKPSSLRAPQPNQRTPLATASVTCLLTELCAVPSRMAAGQVSPFRQ